MASVGSTGASYENALAESFNGLYKTELNHRPGPWRNVEHVEWATLNYVGWFTSRRIHESLDYAAPVEFKSRLRELIVARVRLFGSAKPSAGHLFRRG